MMHDEEVISDLLDQIATLKAECVALRVDAERYRWLRQNRRGPNSHAPFITVFDEKTGLYGLFTGASADAAIYAAREVKL